MDDRLKELIRPEMTIRDPCPSPNCHLCRDAENRHLAHAEILRLEAEVLELRSEVSTLQAKEI